MLAPAELADLMPDATQLERNEPEMASSLHYAQLALLVVFLEWLWRDGQGPASSGQRTDFFIGANLTIYFSREQLKNKDFRGSDFFLIKNTVKRPEQGELIPTPEEAAVQASDRAARLAAQLKAAGIEPAV